MPSSSCSNSIPRIAVFVLDCLHVPSVGRCVCAQAAPLERKCPSTFSGKETFVITINPSVNRFLLEWKINCCVLEKSSLVFCYAI